MMKIEGNVYYPDFGESNLPRPAPEKDTRTERVHRAFNRLWDAINKDRVERQKQGSEPELIDNETKATIASITKNDGIVHPNHPAAS